MARETTLARRRGAAVQPGRRRQGTPNGSRARRAPRGQPRRQVRARGRAHPDHRRPGARAPGARPAPRRPAPRPDHRHDDLRLPGLAARRPRPGAREQPRAARAAPRAPRARPQRGARRDLGVGEPADRPAPRRQARRRARHVVRQGAGPRSGRRRPSPRQLRRRLAHRRRAGRRRRRPKLQVLHDPERVRVAARQPPHAGVLPRQPGRGDRPRPARLRVLARVRAVGRLQDRHERGRRGRHRRRGARPRLPGTARPRLRARAERQPAAPGVARPGAHAAGRAHRPCARVRASERRQPHRGRARRLAGHRRRGQALLRPQARAARPRPRRRPAGARRHPHPQAGDDLAARGRDRAGVRAGPRRDPGRRGEGPVHRDPPQGRALRRLPRAAHPRQARRERPAAAAARAGPRRRPARPRGGRPAARSRPAPRLGRGTAGPPRRHRRPPGGAAHGPARTVLLLRLPAQLVAAGARGHARRRRHRLPHDGAAQPRGERRDHRPHADGWRGCAVDRAGALHRRQAPRPEPRRRHVPPLRLAGRARRRGFRREHHLQAALQRPRRDDRRPADRGPAAGAGADPLARARGRTPDHRHGRGHESLQGREARLDRRAARPVAAARRPAGAGRGRGRDRPDPRPGVRRREAAGAQARQAGGAG